MIRELLRTNSILSFIVIILLFGVLIVPCIWVDHLPSPPKTDVVGSYLDFITLGSSVIESILAVVLIAFSGLMLQSAISRSDIRSSMSLEPLFWYYGLSVPFALSSDPLPLLLAQFFLILAFRRLMTIDTASETSAIAFDSGLYIALAALFDIHFYMALPLIWWAIATFKTVQWRDVVLSLTGAILPLYFLIGGRYVFDLPFVDPLSLSAIPMDTLFRPGTPILIYLVLSIILVVVGIATNFGQHSTHSVRKRNHDQISVGLLVVCLIIAGTNSAKGYNGMVLSTLSFPFTLFLITVFEGEGRALWRNLLTLAWLISAIVSVVFLVRG